METLCTYGGPVLTDLVFQRRWLARDRVLLERHIPRWREGRVCGIVIPVDSYDELSVLLAEIQASEGEVRVASTAADVAAARDIGVIAIILGATFKAMGDNVESLQLYRRLGMRTFALALNPRNLLTDGCGEREASGLSYLGIKAVQEMERLGVAIDLSHTSDKGFWDVLEYTQCPVFVSHSNARAVCDNPRNLSNEQIEALASRQGLVGLSTYPTLVSKRSQPSLNDYLDHIDHIKALVGVEYISIGADFIDYVYDFVNPGVRRSDPTKVIYGEDKLAVTDLENVTCLKNIRYALEARGYSSADTEAIQSGNFLRFLKTMDDFSMDS